MLKSFCGLIDLLPVIFFRRKACYSSIRNRAREAQHWTVELYQVFTYTRSHLTWRFEKFLRFSFRIFSTSKFQRPMQDGDTDGCGAAESTIDTAVPSMMAETVPEISSTVSWVRVPFIARLTAGGIPVQDERIPERMTDSPAALVSVVTVY